LDPLTSAVLTLKEIREMVAEMLEAERAWLPRFESKTLRAAPEIVIPVGTVGVDVPMDPAHAIAKRFIKLASIKAPPAEA
jgi:alpha-galactosidase